MDLSSILLGGAVGFVCLLAIGGVLLKLFWSRPHLQNVPKDNLVKRFQAEREVMLNDLVAKHGLTTELEGYLVTADPKLAKALLLSKAHTALRSRWYRASAYLLHGMDGVLNMHGPEWKAHTRALAAIFQPAHVAKYLETMHEAAATHSKAWLAGVSAEDNLLPLDASSSPASSSGGTAMSGGGPDLLEAVRGILACVLMKWAYGIDVASPDAEERCLARDLAFELANYGKLVGKMGQKPLQLACSYAALVSCTGRLRALTERIVELKRQRKAKGIVSNGGNVDAISRMVDAGFSVKEVAGEVNHIHGAHKAAGYALTHLLHDLAQPPVSRESAASFSISDMSGRWWAEAARREAVAVLGENGIPTRDDLAQDRLPIIKALVLEAQRRHVVSLGVVRRTGEPLNIDGVNIPSGTEVVILLQALHHVPAFWPRPFEFRPERWLKREELHAALTETGFAAASASDGGLAVSAPVDSGENGIVAGGAKQTVSLDSSLVGSGLRNQPSASASAEYAPDPDAEGSSAESGAQGGDLFFTRQQTAAATPSDGTAPGYSPEPYAFIPFLSGARMCAGKALAELELTVCLAAILRQCRVSTDIVYAGHVHGVPKGASAGVAKRYVASSSSLPFFKAVPSYRGPVELLMADNMYSGIDGPVPFTATTTSAATTTEAK